jgi:GNAT superfamily N-acetyltransferase
MLYSEEKRFPDLVIRRARVEDLSSILSLISDGTPEGTPSTIIPDPLPNGYFEAFSRIDSEPNQALMVGELNGEVVGTFQLSFLTYLSGAGREDLQIESVHVAKEHRGKGLGASMMKWAIAAARQKDCRRVQLTTNKKRIDAHRFYENLGFKLSHEGAKMNLD